MRADIIRDKVRAMFSKRTSDLLSPPEETQSRDDRLKRIGIVDSETHEKSQDEANDRNCSSEYSPSVISPTTVSVS